MCIHNVMLYIRLSCCNNKISSLFLIDLSQITISELSQLFQHLFFLLPVTVSMGNTHAIFLFFLIFDQKRTPDELLLLNSPKSVEVTALRKQLYSLFNFKRCNVLLGPKETQVLSVCIIVQSNANCLLILFFSTVNRLLGPIIHVNSNVTLFC